MCSIVHYCVVYTSTIPQSRKKWFVDEGRCYMYVVSCFRAWFVLMETSSGRTPSMPWFPATPSSSWTRSLSWPKGWITLGCLMRRLAFFARLLSLHQVNIIIFISLDIFFCYSLKMTRLLLPQNLLPDPIHFVKSIRILTMPTISTI